MVETMPPSMAAPGAKSPYSDRPIEDIVENLMGIPLPQRSQRYSPFTIAHSTSVSP